MSELQFALAVYGFIYYVLGAIFGVFVYSICINNKDEE